MNDLTTFRNFAKRLGSPKTTLQPSRKKMTFVTVFGGTITITAVRDYKYHAMTRGLEIGTYDYLDTLVLIARNFLTK